MVRKEVDYYNEIAKEIVSLFESNLGDKNFSVVPLVGEISSGLRTLIANGHDAGGLLKDYAGSVHRLHLDVSILIEDKTSGKFEVVIFEIKRVNNLGLAELSQLIGYCLVSKSKFGILMNVDKAVSSEFSIILDGDKDLTEIRRIIDGEEITHQLGVMVWNSETQRVEYTNSGSIRNIPELISLVTSSLAMS